MSASPLAMLDPPAPRTLTTPLRFVPYGVDLWCPVLRAAELGPRGVVKTELLGERVVLFRGEDGAARAFDDRCPHRGVALSLGKVEGAGLRCAYHGWCFGADGALRDVPGMGLPPGETAVRTHPVREAHGLLWMWLGAPAQAEGTPLPDVSPWGTGGSADLLLSLELRAHWSLVLDNGLDLFHQHLHVGVPFFFRVHELVRFGEEGDAFTVRYRASLKNAVDRAREGFIDLAVRDNVLRLDFSGLPIIHAIAAPRSADGRRLTLYWLVSLPSRGLRRWALRAWMPVIRRAMLRGFRQDVDVLQSEQAAFDERSAPDQREINPVVFAAHRYLEGLISRRTRQGVEAQLQGARLEQVSRAALLASTARGEAAVLMGEGAELALVPPDQLEARLPRTEQVLSARYQHFHVVVPG